MNFINPTRMEAGYVLAHDADARQRLVVVVKGTFTIPESGREPVFAEAPAPLVYADVSTGQPGFSATLYESDFAAYKPRCDILLNGSAYAPGGRPARRVLVALEVGDVRKSFRVAGPRVWKIGLFGARTSRPRFFTVMPISYDNAYGGVDNLDKNERNHKTCLLNFAGKGYFPHSNRWALCGKPAPNTEERWTPVKRAGKKYRPMAFGALGRAWVGRREYAGTYDQKWIDNTFPFLPDDFDPRYNQAAPLDQQTDYLQGGEEVRLTHLTPEGDVRFRLPRIDLPVVLTRQTGEEIKQQAVNDTLIIEPDLGRYIRVWRTSFPLKRNIFEVDKVIAGEMPRAWQRARQSGKRYYRSIQEYIEKVSC